MTDELRAAAQLIVDRENSHGGWLDCDDDDSGPATAAKVSRAYLAEHPADDGEPVTTEWLCETGWTKYVIWPSIPLFDELLEWRGAGIWIREIPICRARTRGDVRRLLAALGIEVPK